jgi:hypothetical protein
MNQPYGLAWQRDFAAAHGKPISFPEWGLTIRADGHGGGDNAYYVEHMYDWIAANDVKYHAYYEYDATDGEHRLMTGEFPIGAAAFKRLWGGPVTPDPVPSPTPPVSVRAPAPPPRPRATPTPGPFPTPAPLTTPAPSADDAVVTILQVHASAHMVKVTGRVDSATSGRVRVEVRARGFARSRSTVVHADGSFRAAVRRPAPGRFRIVTSFRPAGTRELPINMAAHRGHSR